MELNDIFLDRLPKIDLHGFDRDSARVRVNDFVEEAYLVGYDEILFIHGIKPPIFGSWRMLSLIFYTGCWAESDEKGDLEK